MGPSWMLIAVFDAPVATGRSVALHRIPTWTAKPRKLWDGDRLHPLAGPSPWRCSISDGARYCCGLAWPDLLCEH